MNMDAVNSLGVGDCVQRSSGGPTRRVIEVRRSGRGREKRVAALVLKSLLSGRETLIGSGSMRCYTLVSDPEINPDELEIEKSPTGVRKLKAEIRDLQKQLQAAQGEASRYAGFCKLLYEQLAALVFSTTVDDAKELLGAVDTQLGFHWRQRIK